MPWSTDTPWNCDRCGRFMWTSLGELARGRRRFCSKGCVTGARSEKDYRERFWKWAVVADDPDACWGWTGPVQHDARPANTRRGVLSVVFQGQRKHLTIGPLSWLVHHGRLPEQWVLHRCDNPMCGNPRHLFLGTPRHNVLDMLFKKRRGNCGAKLTDAAVLAMRAEWDAPGSTIGLIELGKRYGVSRGTVWLVCTRRSWTHLP